MDYEIEHEIHSGFEAADQVVEVKTNVGQRAEKTGWYKNLIEDYAVNYLEIIGRKILAQYWPETDETYHAVDEDNRGKWQSP